MKKAMIFLLVIILLCGAEYVRSNKTVGVSHHTIAVKNLPKAFEQYSILQLSDLHSKSVPNLTKIIREENPDIVVMTGDMINSSDRDFSSFLHLAGEIAAQTPTYFIVGNHEQALPEATLSSLLTRLSDAGVYVLDNNFVRIERGKAHINLYGMWFHLRFYRDIHDERTKAYTIGEREMTKILGAAQRNDVNLLLAHNPVYFPAYASWGADLTLSGHMHGGMIRIPLKGGVLSPEKEYFPQYDVGVFYREDCAMLVSRGLGEYAGFRFWNQPEIIVIHLTNKST